MNVLNLKFLLTCLICLTSSACVTQPVQFQWLDIAAVPLADADRDFLPGDTYGDLAGAYIQLKQECRATNNGVSELLKAQDKIKRVNK